MPDPKQANGQIKDIKNPGKVKEKKNRTENMRRFMAETRGELKKIVWPTPQKVFNNTLIVLFAIFIIGIFIWIVDFITSAGLNALLNAFG